MNEPTLQNDPNIKLPPSVVAAAKMSEQLYSTFIDTNLNEDGSARPLEVTPEVTAGADEAAADAGQSAASLAQDVEPVVLQEPERKKKKPEAEPEDEEGWEHKYKSLHGRFMRQGETLKTSLEENGNLRMVLSQLQAQAAFQPAPSAQADDLLQDSELTEDERNDYGDDFLKVVSKRVRQELAPIVKNYEAQISSLQSRVDGVTTTVKETSTAKMLNQMDQILPEWREINTDLAFSDWLALPDAYSGAIRHDMLKAAYAQGNASRVLAFFNGFLAEEAAVAPVRAEPDPSTTTVAKVPLRDLAAPGRAKTAASATQAPAEKPIFTRAQITAFYADCANGAYRGREVEKDKLEGQIFAAQREGRIR